MDNVCICVSKISVIVLKSENKRLTCYIMSVIGSLGDNPAAPAVPAGFLCSFRESHYAAAAAEETVLSLKDLCSLTRWQIWMRRKSDWIFPLLFSAEGEVYTWGKGARGRLGRKEEDCGIPKALQLDESHPYVVTSVACFNGNSLLAVKRNISLITS